MHIRTVLTKVINYSYFETTIRFYIALPFGAKSFLLFIFVFRAHHFSDFAVHKQQQIMIFIIFLFTFNLCFVFAPPLLYSKTNNFNICVAYVNVVSVRNER